MMGLAEPIDGKASIATKADAAKTFQETYIRFTLQIKKKNPRRRQQLKFSLTNGNKNAILETNSEGHRIFRLL
jgi:hypothetical protein